MRKLPILFLFMSVISNVIAQTVTDLSHPESFVIYPNPADDKIQLGNYDQFSGLLTISDIYGRILLNRQIDFNPVDISVLIPGIYIVRFVGSNNILTTKLIKK